MSLVAYRVGRSCMAGQHVNLTTVQSTINNSWTCLLNPGISLLLLKSWVCWSISSHQLVQPRIQACALNSQKLQIKQKHHRQRRIGRSVINTNSRGNVVLSHLGWRNSHGSSGIKNRTPCFVVFVGNFPRMQTLTWATENSIRATRISNCLPEGQVHFFLFREPWSRAPMKIWMFWTTGQDPACSTGRGWCSDSRRRRCKSIGSEQFGHPVLKFPANLDTLFLNPD